MTRPVVTVAAIHRKIQAWLAEDDSQTAIALRAQPKWLGEPVLAVGQTTVRIVECPTPIAARAALHERAEGERVALLTELSDNDLGDGVLAHVSRCTVRSVDAWDVVRQMFGVDSLDPTLAERRYGGGRWLADALAEYAPMDGWPPPPGTVLTRDHALRSLIWQLLGIEPDQVDISGLLTWTTDPGAVLSLTSRPDEVVTGISHFIEELIGPAAVPLIAAVRAGHGADAIPLGLLAAALWPEESGDPPARPVSEIETRLADRRAVAAEARGRAAVFFGSEKITPLQAQALRTAAEAWIDRAFDSGEQAQARRLLARAEQLAEQVGAEPLLGSSDWLPGGFALRLREFAVAVGRAVEAVAGPREPGRPWPKHTGAVLSEAQKRFAAVAGHRCAPAKRVEAARAALRLLRWLATKDEPVGNLLEALHRYVRDDGWVDRARLDVFAGDVDPEVGAAYRALHQAVDARRAQHDQRFASLLAEVTRSESPPGSLIRVEDVLDRVVAPILKRGRPVLLLIMDGMGMPAAIELVESLTRSGQWLELTPDGGPRTGVLAALPTVTEVSRCSLLSGRIAVGSREAERAAFAARFPNGLLLHKADLRAGAGHALEPDVVAAVREPGIPIVAAVINTIDDALDRSNPGTEVWTEENTGAVRDLLSEATERVVVLVSDHGHVVDRGPDGVVAASSANENRWRPADRPAGDGEVLVQGSRVGLGGGRAVLAVREETRYGPRKAGYHGGAAPAEAVIPLIVLSPGKEDAVPGWSGAPVASPGWWREGVIWYTSVPGAEAGRAAGEPGGPAEAAGRQRKATRAALEEPTLFDLKPVPAPKPAPEPAARDIVEQLLASELYAQRRAALGRNAVADERVAALLRVLLAGHGKATMDTLAVGAEVPAHRISHVFTALRRMLQVEGYPVFEVHDDEIVLNVSLLVEQFGLERT